MLMILISKTLILVITTQINQHFRFLRVLLEICFALEQVCKQAILFITPPLSFPHHKWQQQQVGSMEKDFEMAICRAGYLLGSTLGTNICEGNQEAGLTRGRNSNHDQSQQRLQIVPLQQHMMHIVLNIAFLFLYSRF